jgi:uncharacterized membrane protein
MSRTVQHHFWLDFRTFFVRGLAVLLPSIVTLWLLWQAFAFLFANVAEPINRGIRIAVVEVADLAVDDKYLPGWYQVSDEDIAGFRSTSADPLLRTRADEWIVKQIRRDKLRSVWQTYWLADVTGLFVAIVLLYLMGRLLGSFVGRWAYARVEKLLQAVPGFKQVYPHVKQVVDLVMGDQKMAFSRVVLIEYPRKGIWTIGLVTSSSIREIAEAAGEDVLCVFVPTSPTPFTGFTMTVPAKDCIDTTMTVDEAIRFVITAGVLVPEKLQMPPASGAPQIQVPSAVPVQTGAESATAIVTGTGVGDGQGEAKAS